jgi:phosphoglycolate phosphatase
MSKTLLFDFDGTIADTFSAVIGIFNEFSEEYGFDKVEGEELLAVREKTIPELLDFLGVPKSKVNRIVRLARTRMRKDIDSLNPFEDICENLDILKSTGYKLGVVTSNSRENVKRFFERHEMDQFNFIDAGSRLLSKSYYIKRRMKRDRLSRDDVLYVGDEVRDIEAARQSGVKNIAVSWGFNSRRYLAKYKPDYLIDKPGELLTVVTQL